MTYVVTGSTAALLHGVRVTPGDLDITPALDAANLERLARACDAIDAHPDPDGPFGDWRPQPDGERGWVARDPRPGEREARAQWRPDPCDPATFDEQLVTRHGALDIVPEIAGPYAELVSRAVLVEAFGRVVRIESLEDLLEALTVPRRAKDRDRVLALRDLLRARVRR